MNTRVRFLILLFVAVILLCGRVEAQSTFGSMRGMTLDQTGGGVPQARVVLHSVDENADSTTTSDDQGNFAFENIKPGKYTLTASKDGFSNGVVNGVELAARQDLRLDVKLAVASVAAGGGGERGGGDGEHRKRHADRF